MFLLIKYQLQGMRASINQIMELKQFIIVAAFFCIFKSATGQSLLPCDSTFRFLRPDLFDHCTTCRYSDWTEWKQVPNSVGPDKSGNCPSGEAYSETRRQYSLVLSCNDNIQTRSVCVPTQTERLSLFLGLGSPKVKTVRPLVPDIFPTAPPSEQTPSPPGPRGLPGPRGPRSPLRFARQAGRCNEGSICQNLSGKRKRDTTEEANMNEKLSPRNEPSRHAGMSSVHHNPLPFNIAEDGHRLKRQVRQCADTDKQHVLFMLDISGSIGRAEFEKVKEAVSNLTLLFCRDIEVAVLTFNQNFHLEFCFNCYDEHDTLGPYTAIRNIPFRGGLTHTAGATKCACESLLGPSCGIEFATETCVDIVYITDGKSNDPNLNVCNEVKCMHNHLLKMNTYSIGIKNANQQELDCIQEDSNNLQSFWFDTFQEFYNAMKELYEKPKQVLC